MMGYITVVLECLVRDVNAAASLHHSVQHFRFLLKDGTPLPSAGLFLHAGVSEILQECLDCQEHDSPSLLQAHWQTVAEKSRSVRITYR